MATREITDLLRDALDDDVIYPYFAVELQFDGNPLYLWTGVGTATIDGNEYAGTGNLLNVSSIEETSDIAVRGATLTLAGVPSEVLSLALQTPYQGRVCNISFGVLALEAASEYIVEGHYPGLILDFASDYYATTEGDPVDTTSLVQIFSGYMDEMNIDEGPDTSTVELKVENKLVDLERARVRRFTSGYQKSVYPGDKGLDFVESLQDKDLLWGRKVEN